MTEYEIIETTIEGERLDIRTDLDANSYSDAVAKYFKQHSDPKTVR